jgi:hypothetical protein
MPTSRLVFRAYSPLYDTNWRREWTESRSGEFVTMVKAMADDLEQEAPVIVKQAADAQERERERQARIEEELRRQRVSERAKARQQARQAAKDELRAIVKAWNDAFALEAFFTELSRRAAALNGEERHNLEKRIASARQLMGGRDAVERFLQWTLLEDAEPNDEHDQCNDDEDEG